MKYLVMISLFLNCYFSFSQITNTDVVAKLEIEVTDDVPLVLAAVSNRTDVYHSLRYVLSLITQFPDRTTSKESFEDLFAIEPNESIQLRKEPIVLDKGNDMIILLLVYDKDDKLIGKDRLVLSEALQKNKPNDGIKLMGLVTDETKTKFGKDFYDYFYFYFTYYKIESNKVVNVEEVVTFGRNTQIKVTIDDNVIFAFFSKPDIEYLEDMSKVALQRVYKYLQKLKRENAYITKY